MNITVLGKLLAPVVRGLAQVRGADAVSRMLSMADFIGLRVLRRLQGMRTLREQVQSLLHWELGMAQRVPLARSTWSDALSLAPPRGLAGGDGAIAHRGPGGTAGSSRANLCPARKAVVYAMKGTYQSERAHFGRCTPRQGREDNPKGHALLSFYDVRLCCPADVYVDTRSRHETVLLRDYDQAAQAMTRQKGAQWLADRAFINAAFWADRKKGLGVTPITRMKSSLCIDFTEGLAVADVPANERGPTDPRITLRTPRHCWRLVTYRSRRGHLVEFLTNEFKLGPALIAFLYSRRWEEESWFDTWKNDFSQAKAWGASMAAIGNQVRLVIATCLLVALLVHRRMGQHGIEEEKALRKQDRCQTSAIDGTYRPGWSTPVFRYTSKVNRRVLRLFKHCFHKPASQALYETQLRPLLLAYL